MRSLGFRFLLCTLAATVWGPGAARADWWPVTETVYAAPAALALPTSYLVPSSYVVPVTSVVPTVYATAYYPSSYAWTPTAYYTTSYVPTGYYLRERRPLLSRVFGRRDYLVPTTIYYPSPTVVPTTTRYYAPTVLDYPVIAETRYRGVASACGICDDAVVVASAAPIERRVIRDAESAPKPRKQPRVESNSVEDQETTSSEVPPTPEPSRVDPNPPPAELEPIPPAKSSEALPDRTAAPDTPTGVASPPTSPAATPKSGSVRSSAPPRTGTVQDQAGSGAQTAPREKKAESSAPNEQNLIDKATELPPVAPGSGPDDDGLPPARLDDRAAPLTTRDSMKPSYNLSRRPTLSLLKGRVRSGATSEPEGDVRVTLSSRTRAFEDRTTYTNDSGRFALNVPDGDWTVKVTMPSGRIYPVYRITVSGGTIIDDNGRDIPALVITR
jgi:hypothetical protein